MLTSSGLDEDKDIGRDMTSSSAHRARKGGSQSSGAVHISIKGGLWEEARGDYSVGLLGEDLCEKCQGVKRPWEDSRHAQLDFGDEEGSG